MIRPSIHIRTVKTTVISMLCWGILLTSFAFGQIAPPPGGDIDSPKKTRVKTSSEARALAKDYLSILEQLEVLTTDYGTYLSEMSDKLAAFERKRLAFVATRLAKGKYYDDISRLQKDLDDLQRELKKYRHNTTDLQKDEAKVLRNLHRDITLLNTTFEFEILEELKNNRKLQDELVSAIALERPKLRETHNRLLSFVIQLDDTTITLNLPDIDINALPDMKFELSKTPVVSVKAIEILETQAPEVAVNFRMKKGITGFTREFVDSIDVPSLRTPIVINNPFGDIIVSGWAGNKVLVRSEIEATATGEKQAQELADKVKLSLCPKPEGICIEFVLPHLGDLGTVVTKSLLEVRVPMKNPVQCINGYGKLTVKDLNNSVEIQSNNSSIDLSKIKGDIRITNSNGRINLSDLNGNLLIDNSNGAITINDSRGTFTIENRYAQITLNNCKGNASISNNGPMQITDHTGNISLQNHDGLIEVQRLNGNITAETSMAPIRLVEIDGSATISNEHGPIDIYDVSGSLSVTNTSAPIEVRYPSGLLNLTNNNGSIDVVLSESISGSSRIVSQGGVVKVAWNKNMDLDLEANTNNGVITSTWPFTINSNGVQQSTKLTFGTANYKIQISGDNSNIYLAEVR